MSEYPFAGAPGMRRYTRRQAIEEGLLIDLMLRPTLEQPDLDDLAALVRQAGFSVPVAMTATAFDKAVAPPGGDLPPKQDLQGRLWDCLWELRCAIRGHRGREAEVTNQEVRFSVRVWREKGYEGWTRRSGHAVVRLKGRCGPGDEGEPVITLLMPWEIAAADRAGSREASSVTITKNGHSPLIPRTASYDYYIPTPIILYRAQA
jgi:hypothetical protein